MKEMLPADDLNLGLFITIHTGQASTSLGFIPGTQGQPREKYYSLKGYVLKVVAIDLPYISVNYHVLKELQNTVIDIRDAVLIRLSNEFVVAVDPLFKDDIVEEKVLDI